MNLESIKSNFSNYLDYLNEAEKTKATKENSEANIFATKDEINKEYANISVNELKNLVVEDGKVISEEDLDALDNAIPKEEETKSKEAVLKQLTTELINNEEFIETFDKDNNNNISTEELQAFINAVDEMDGEEGNISISDIINGIVKIATGDFFSKKAEEVEAANENAKSENTETQEQKVDNSGVGNNVNIGRSGGISASSTTNTLTGVNSDINEKNLEQMGTEELKNELATANNTLEAKKEELTKIQTGENDTLKGLEKNIEQTYEKYQEQAKLVDEKLAEKVDETKNNISAKENEIRQNDSKISMQKTSVSSAENQYENAKNHTKSLKEKLESLTGKLGHVIKKIKAKLEKLISSLRSKIQRAEADENRKKSNVEKEKNKLTDLENNDIKLKNDKTKLENQLSAYQEEIQDKKPQIAQYFQDYQNAKDNYAQQKAAMIDAAQQTVEAAQTYVNKINTALKVKETSEEIKETTLQQYDDEAGSKILNTVMANLEGTDGNCLQSVTETIEKVCNSNKKLGTNVTDIAKRLSGNEAGYEDISNNFEEVNIDRGELANLPAGCVIVWENGIPEPAQGHTAITDGKGGEYSNGYQDSINYADSEVGYRVFIPTGIEE